MDTDMNTGMGDYILVEWECEDSSYPERIMAHRNKKCVQLYNEHNELKAGFGVFCGVTLHRLKSRMEFPWVPGLVHAFTLFFDKPERVKCWKKWIKYCWLELKEEAMLTSRLWLGTDVTDLWVLRSFDGKFLVWTDKDDIGEDVDVESLRRYRWSSEDNSFMPYVHKEMSFMDMLTVIGSEVYGSC